MQIKLPEKKPRIRKKDPAPDQRSITVCPIRAATDRKLTPMQLRALLVLCSYTNKAGVTWVGLERVGQDLGVSRERAGFLIRKLIERGYVRVIHKGFKGYCADSRQIIFKQDIGPDEAAAVAGELAPYQIKQQQREAEQMQEKKTRGRRKKAKAIEGINRSGDIDSIPLSAVESRDSILVENELHTLTQIYDADLLALAALEAGPGATTDELAAAAERLLR